MISIDSIVGRLEAIKARYGINYLPTRDDAILPPIGLKVKHLQELEYIGGPYKLHEVFFNLDPDTSTVKSASPGFDATHYTVQDIYGVQYELRVIWAADFTGFQIESIALQ